MNKRANNAPNFEFMSERIELIMNVDFLNMWHNLPYAGRFSRQDDGNQGIDLLNRRKAWNSPFKIRLKKSRGT
jgi:hypothetical protein